LPKVWHQNTISPAHLERKLWIAPRFTDAFFPNFEAGRAS
jgi:hypothetical protein